MVCISKWNIRLETAPSTRKTRNSEIICIIKTDTNLSRIASLRCFDSMRCLPRYKASNQSLVVAWT